MFEDIIGYRHDGWYWVFQASQWVLACYVTDDFGNAVECTPEIIKSRIYSIYY